MTCNIIILQSDIDRLREPTYKPQTFRIGDYEIEQLRDLTYELSKRLKRRKVTQGDILRLALLMFSRSLKNNKEEIEGLIKAIK